jgi:hypothetical protein
MAKYEHLKETLNNFYQINCVLLPLCPIPLIPLKILLSQVFGTCALDAIETPKIVVPIQYSHESMFTFNLTTIKSQTSANAEYLFVRESYKS